MTIRVSNESWKLAERQRGILARWQVAGRAGDLTAIDSLVRSGRWRRLYRGVYATYTGPPSRTSMLWAGVRRCGPEAALSHFSAAEVDGISDDRSHAIHVSIPSALQIRVSAEEFRGRIPAVIVHRSQRIRSARHPVKAPPRTKIEDTVLDLTDVARTFDAAFSWLSAACGRGLTTADQIREAADSRARLRWRTDIMAAIAEINAGVLSSLERRYLHDVERPHGLPEPKRQSRHKIGARSAYLDNLYDDYGLGVELDGLASHLAETRWQDIHRDNELLASAGITTLRYNWTDVTLRPCQVAAEVAQALRSRGWTGTFRKCRRCGTD